VPARRSGVTARRRGNLLRLLHFVRNDNLKMSIFLSRSLSSLYDKLSAICHELLAIS
jgi:hypothetical protein